MKLKDTLTQNLKTLPAKQVIKIYSCGPTVYDYPHLGNWYAFLRWDLLVRTLKSLNFKVLWVMNITDVGHLVSDADDGEDKLAKKARKERMNAYQVAKYYGDYFLEALKRLNFVMPNHLPYATQHIEQQVALIEALEAQGLTYIIDDGVYYDTSRFSDYGKLAQHNRSGFIAGARVDYNNQKKQATDFALWKFSPKDQARDMEWDSPWGKGFPGWHLECSAMANFYLGSPIDIHTGGIDHIPIHHTNELAQSEPVYSKPWVNIWLHSNFITINGNKMSKSSNNFYTLEDIENQGYSLMTLRLAVFASRYSKAVDFSWDTLEQAQSRLARWKNLAVRRFQLQSKIIPDQTHYLQQNINNIKKDLASNLNSPAALRRIDQVCQALNDRPLSSDLYQPLSQFCQFLDSVLGLNISQTEDLNTNQKQLLQQRQTARLNGDFRTSDRLRQQLTQNNLHILDTEFGQIWQLNS